MVSATRLWTSASCLAHLLFEAAHQPSRYAACLSCFEALAETYVDGVDWEPGPDLERRTALLLPPVLLALIGTDSSQSRAHVEGAVKLVRDEVDSVEEIRGRWRDLVA